MNERKVNEIVKGLKIKESEQGWTELLSELKQHKSQVVTLYFNGLKKMMSKEDVIALYEDALLASVSNFSLEFEAGFMPFFRNNLLTHKNMVLRNQYRFNRVGNWQDSVSGDVSLTSISDETFFDAMEDSDSSRGYEETEVLMDMKKKLADFFNSGSKREEQAKLLMVVLANAEATQEELREELLKALPEGTSWVSARKKLQRAREEFKVFLEIN